MQFIKIVTAYTQHLKNTILALWSVDRLERPAIPGPT